MRKPQSAKLNFIFFNSFILNNLQKGQTKKSIFFKIIFFSPSKAGFLLKIAFIRNRFL
jgi:hypothetical protein